MIKVLFFAQLREQLHCDQVEVECPSPSNLSWLREQLVEANPQWKEFLVNEKLLFSVNQTIVKASHVVKDGDEVAFFPPVTGG